MTSISKFLKNRKGFTLIEMVIYLIVLSLIVGSLFTVLLTVQENRTRTMLRMELEYQASFAMTKILKHLQHTVKIMGGTQFNQNPGRLHIKPSITGPITKFEVVDNRLQMREGGGFQNVTSYITGEFIGIKEFILKDVGDDDKEAVRITLTLQYNSAITGGKYDIETTLVTTGRIPSPEELIDD